MDRGAWQATIHGVTKSWTRMKWISMQYITYLWRLVFTQSVKKKLVLKTKLWLKHWNQKQVRQNRKCGLGQNLEPLLLLLLFSHSVLFNSLQSHGLQHTRLPVLHHLPELAQTHVHWVSVHWVISSSVVPFSSCLQSFPASGSFLMSWLFPSCGQIIGASVPVLPMNSLVAQKVKSLPAMW